MEKTGDVILCRGGEVIVKIERQSACGNNCASCGACADGDLLVTIPCGREKYAVGERVTLVYPDGQFIRGSFFCYFLPVIIMAVISVGVYILTESEGASAMLGLCALIAYVVGVKLIGRHKERVVVITRR